MSRKRGDLFDWQAIGSIVFGLLLMSIIFIYAFMAIPIDNVRNLELENNICENHVIMEWADDDTFAYICPNESTLRVYTYENKRPIWYNPIAMVGVMIVFLFGLLTLAHGIFGYETKKEVEAEYRRKMRRKNKKVKK